MRRGRARARCTWWRRDSNSDLANDEVIAAGEHCPCLQALLQRGLLSRKWIQCFHACSGVASDVARYDGEIMDQCDSGDLLIQGIFAVRHAKTAPNLGRLVIDRQNRIGKFARDSIEPAFQALGLKFLATMPNCVDDSPQFTDGHSR